jgi:hypothetical protein
LEQKVLVGSLVRDEADVAVNHVMDRVVTSKERITHQEEVLIVFDDG